MKYSVLIIDDERELAESTAEYFNLFDVTACCVFTAEDGLRFFEENETDLILLDINLQGDSGFALCRRLRESVDVPILFISARSSEDDMVAALNIGGDDYICKPYSLNVLYAKVKAVLKRYGGSRTSAGQGICIEDIVIDCSTGIVTRKGQEVRMTAMEYKLLFYMAQNRDRVITKQELFDHVWEEPFVSDGTLNVHIRHLREKLEADPDKPRRIKTIWGVGYMLNTV
ncbi:MAG: response regulator transcription factor [Lachnospiraceae bacterium]|nr:response regulator transcription factor [Lachnospiraceae bacterium]